MSADENISMAHLPSFCRHGVIAERQRRQASTAAAQQMDLRVGSLPQRIATLSGGNQQKALLARYLIRRPAVLILDEPTRGVDIGAREKIYAVINQLTTSGLGVLMISSDLPEVLGMSDRVLVMNSGRITGTFTRREATAERVMDAATRERA